MRYIKMHRTMKIAKRCVGENCPAYIIAEIGRTHNNDLQVKKQMIEEVANCGADAVKMQSIQANDLLVKNIHTDLHYCELEKLEMLVEEHFLLKDIAADNGIEFISTPESLKMVDLLETLGVNVYKISSLDIVYYDLLKHVAEKEKPMLLSTGMATMGEIGYALKIIEDVGNEDTALLYCVSLYPPEYEEMNLKKIVTLSNHFDVVTGFSDHSIGITAVISAVALGATIIEKHFTLDKTQNGSDHMISLDPRGFKTMVREIRNVEAMLAPRNEEISRREKTQREVKRRKIVAALPLKKGIEIKKEDLKFKQTDTYDGIPAQYIRDVVGKMLRKDMEKDEIFSYGTLTVKAK